MEEKNEKSAMYPLKYQKSNHQLSNEKFNRAIGNNIPEIIEFNNNLDSRILCAKLIIEEFFEVIDALGFKTNILSDDIVLIEDDEFNDKNSLEKCSDLIKELCDLKYVTTGCLSVITGAPDTPFQKIVDENNLSKIDIGHSFNEYGKLIKPPNYKKVDFKDLIKDINEQQKNFED